MSTREPSLGIVGVGLIGGSLALGLKASGYRAPIVGIGRNAARLQKAQDLGVVDRIETDFARAASQVDVLLLAVPMAAMSDVLQQMVPHLHEQAVLTDAGSVKGSFVAAALAAGADPARLVPGHPIAGTEKSGVEAAFATLYQNRRVILTPLAQSSAEAVACVHDLWARCGASVEYLEVERHDRVLAATSHLPHMLAFSLVDTLVEMDAQEETLRYAAGGFRDFSRIAASDPVMWRDVALTNRDALLAAMDAMQTRWQKLRDAIAEEDAQVLADTFARARAARQAWVDGAVPSPQERT